MATRQEADTTDSAPDEDTPEYRYYLDFDGRGSLWSTARNHMRVVEGGRYRRRQRTTSNTITKHIHITELDPETGEVEYTVTYRGHTSTHTGVAEGMGQLRAKNGTPKARLDSEELPDDVTPHNTQSGWPSRPIPREEWTDE